MSLLQKLDQIVARHAELQAALSGGASIRRSSSRRRRNMPSSGRWSRRSTSWRKAEQELKDTEAMAADPDMQRRWPRRRPSTLKKRLPELERP